MGTADEVLRRLRELSESLPLAENQDPERLQASIALPAEGEWYRFQELCDLAAGDWRDALVGAGLGDEDWPEVLDLELGTGTG